MENSFLLAQIIGFVSLILTLLRMQIKQPRYIALGEVPTASLWGLQYYLLNAQAGMIICLLSIVRGLLVFCVPDKYLKHVLIAFVSLITFLLIINYSGHYDLFALAGIYLYAIACLFRDNRPLMARIILIHCIPWIVYNVITFSIFAGLSSFLGMFSCIIGMARHEKWDIGKCYRTFSPSIMRSLLSGTKLRTYP
ncbi:MAG: YgjV family protein [Pseudomonadota bacterium]